MWHGMDPFEIVWYTKQPRATGNHAPSLWFGLLLPTCAGKRWKMIRIFREMEYVCSLRAKHMINECFFSGFPPKNQAKPMISTDDFFGFCRCQLAPDGGPLAAQGDAQTTMCFWFVCIFVGYWEWPMTIHMYITLAGGFKHFFHYILYRIIFPID